MKFLRVTLVALFVVTVSAQTNNSRNAFFAAIQRGDAGQVESLLRSGVSPNLADAEGTTALMSAVLFGDARLVKLLLQRGADPNLPGPSGATALMWAVPDLEKVRILLAHGADVNARAESDRTALLVASSYPGTLNLLRLLLDHGADLHVQDKGGATGRCLAIRSSDIDVVRFLVERGLDPNGLNPAARRASFARYDLPTTEYLMSKALGGIPDVLITAAAWESPVLLNRWLESGANVNATNPAQYGRTPLLTAVTSEAASPETVKLLLDHGADPNVRTTEGESALDWAIYKGDQAKIRILRQYQATRGNGPRQDEIPPAEKGSGIRDSRV